MKKIKINGALPLEYLPKFVRQAFVNCVIPLVDKSEINTGYFVRASDAVASLLVLDKKLAAKFLQELIAPEGYLFFAKEVCEEIPCGITSHDSTVTQGLHIGLLEVGD